MKNKLFSWTLTIVICILLIPIGYFFYIISLLWKTIDKAIKQTRKIWGE